MCSWGMSTLLWPGRSGALGRDYMSYNIRTSSSGRRHSYNRPAPLAYSVGAGTGSGAGASSGSGAYYGSRYHPSSSRADPWTPPPRVVSFSPSQRGHGARSHRGHTSSCRAAADAFRNSSSGGGASFDPVPSRRPSGQKRVHFADSVECVYPGGGRDDQAGSRRHRRRHGEDEYGYGHGRSGSRGNYHDYSRHDDQAGHEDTYYDAYERSPRAAIQRRNSTRLDDAGMEDTRRRAGRLGRRGDLRSVKVEVMYS